MTEDLTGELVAMVDERDVLVGQGLWRSGPRTMLGALGVQYREIMLTAGPAWLLQPDGHHRMGSAALDGFLRHLDIVLKRWLL